MLFCIFTNDYKFLISMISVMNISSKHSNLNFAYNFCYFIDCSKMARIRINTRSRTEEKPYMVNLYFFCKIDKAKRVNRVSKIRVFILVRYVLKEFFVSFPWRLKNVKSRSKYPFFSNERHFEIWFPKKETITFFREKNYLNNTKKTQFFMWQLYFPKNKGKQEQALQLWLLCP